jgi:hypothetical protein
MSGLERVEMINANRPWSVDGGEDRCAGEGLAEGHFGELVAITSLLAWTDDVRRGNLIRKSGWGRGKLMIGDGDEQRNRKWDVESIVKGDTCFVDEGLCRENLMRRTLQVLNNVLRG